MSKLATVLIVDDEPFNVDLIVQELDFLEFETITASSGQQAIDVLDERPCDVVLLDIMMPGMSGFDVLERLRADGRLASLPVIVISALDDLENVVRCIELGAEDYLTKPFNPALLKARMHATLEKKRLRDKVAQQLAITRKIFGQYVPESVAESILAGHGVLEPVQTIATILYADLEGFTGIVERMMSPQRVVQMLNEYFAAVVEPINRHGGILTQFQGDATLVTFNLPVADVHHADSAVQVASEIQQMLKQQKFAGVSLRTRIGIATGEILGGNVGSGDRINYTVYGDAVNLAARLADFNKECGTQSLMSDDTVVALNGSYAIEPVGEVTIRGKHIPVDVHKLTV
ncbi:MAG: response regulator [Gammaproteobacteria bacterium]|nr:response regulator [Gammaproteobacteria bacterium]MDH3466858.1 response regulator [Gammaproteobacteria bacterium]